MSLGLFNFSHRTLCRINCAVPDIRTNLGAAIQTKLVHLGKWIKSGAIQSKFEGDAVGSVGVEKCCRVYAVYNNFRP